MQSVSTKRNSVKEENTIYRIWFKYIPYWPLFIVLLLLGVSIAYIYLKYTIPQYESMATIMIKDEKKGLDDSKMIESLNLIQTKKIIENETEVLRSKTLMKTVVKKLCLYAPVFEQGKFVARSAYTTSPIVIQSFQPDDLTDTQKIYFSFNAIKEAVTINGQSYEINKWEQTPYGVIKFILNPKAKFAAGSSHRKLYFSLINPSKITDPLTQSLVITSASKLSTVINLKIKDQVPERGADVLNELIRTYNITSISDKNVLASNTLGFVNERLKFIEKELNSIEHKIEKFRSSKSIVDISSQGKIFLENVSANDQKLAEINMQMAVLDKVEQYVVDKDSRGGMVPSIMDITNPLLTQLLEKLYNTELEYEKLKKTTAENNPILVSLNDQIAKIKPGILENIKSQRQALLASKANLSGTNSAYNSYLQTIPATERELVEISRQQSIKRNIYSFLLEKREEAELSNSSTVPDSRVVDYAEPSFVPVSPSKKVIYGFAVIAAFASGLSILWLKDLLNRKIMFRDEIERFTSMPVVAEIGHNKTKNQLVMGDDQTNYLAEQFRRLRVSLPNLGINTNRKKILITSTISGEGKSFVAANLGLSLSLIGKKVVLVDFDLVNPSLAKKLNQDYEKGVSDYLIGSVEPEEIIKRTNVNENLFFITAGEQPKNPSELIMSERSAELLNYLNNVFDYVIVDCAPVGALSDAYILSPLCDATLYIIRHKFTPKILVQRLDVNNEITNLKNVSIIFNGIRSSAFNKAYGYGYGYSTPIVHGKNLLRTAKI